MTTLATLLLPTMMTGVDVVPEAATCPTIPPERAAIAALYPPNDPEGPDDDGTGEGEGSGGSAGGTGE